MGAGQTNTQQNQRISNRNHHSDQDIMNMVSRMMLNKQRETFSDTLNFDQVQTEAVLTGGRRNNIVQTKNRYEKYNLASLQQMGGGVDSEQYNEIKSDVTQFNTLKRRLEQELERANNVLTGGCGCEGNESNIAVLSGGAKDRNKEHNKEHSKEPKKQKSDDDDEDIDDEDEDEDIDDDDLELASELESDIEAEFEKEDSEQSRPSKKSRKSKSKKQSKHANSEYSMSDSHSSTINIVPFYSTTPSESEYYSHLRNKGRFN